MNRVVQPSAPTRKWVLILPIDIATVAFAVPLYGAALAVFLRTVQAWYRQQARYRGLLRGLSVLVIFAQRFSSALNLIPHFHVLMLELSYSTMELLMLHIRLSRRLKNPSPVLLQKAHCRS